MVTEVPPMTLVRRTALAATFAAWFAAITVAPRADADDAAFLEAWKSIRGDELARHVEELASDAYGGRAPGTPGETKTLAYLESEFARAGATPGASDGTWRQAVPLAEVRVTGTPRFSVRGPRGKE